MNHPIIKKLIPHGISLLIFLAITAIYFYPQIFQGKVLNSQHDILMWKGSASEIIQYAKDHPGEHALWTNSMFGGMPSYQILMDYPANKITFFNYVFYLGIPNPAGSLFQLMFCFYILMLTFNTNRWIAVAGAIAYAFSSYNMINLDAGHETKVWAVGFAPLVLAAVNLGFRGNWLWALIMGIIGVGMQVNANHLQITYYLLLIILCWGIAEFIHAFRSNSLKPFLIGCAGAIGGALIGLGLNLTNLMLTNEYSKYTIREKSELTKTDVVKDQTGGLGYDYATQWSNGRVEPLSIIIPDVVGGGSSEELSKSSKTGKLFQSSGIPLDNLKQMPTYHGKQPFTSGPIYYGSIVCFLCVLGLLVIKNEMKYALIIISVLAFLLSMGKNMDGLSRFFFETFPFYNKFRAVTMIMVIGQICFPILAFLGLNEWFKKGNKTDQQNQKKKLIWAFGITGSICILFVLLPGIFLDFSSDQDSRMQKELANALVEDRESMTRMSALRSLIYIGLTFGILWYWLSGKLKDIYVYISIIILAGIDLIQIDKRYMNNSKFAKKNASEANEAIPTDADRRIMADKEPGYRVLSFDVSPFNDATVSFFHKSVGGYHGAKFRRYQELREAYMDEPIGMVQQNLKNFPAGALIDTFQAMKKMEIFNMMNTKYFIAGGQEYINNSRYGAAWFVGNILWVNNADQEIDTLDQIDLKSTVVVNAIYKSKSGNFSNLQVDSSDKIKLSSYSPVHLTYTSETSKELIAVFSEIYYDKGWNALIDGKPADYFKANYVLRAMKIPAGKHTIEWIFEPETYTKGQTLAGLCSGLLFLFLGFGLWKEYKKNLAT